MVSHPSQTPSINEPAASKLRQGVMLGRMRYVLGISLVLVVIAFCVVYVSV